MPVILHLLVMFVADIFKSRRRLEAENLFSRHQLNIALRRAPPGLRLHGSDGALLVWMTRIWNSLLDVDAVKPCLSSAIWARAAAMVNQGTSPSVSRRSRRGENFFYSTCPPQQLAQSACDGGPKCRRLSYNDMPPFSMKTDC